MARPPLKVAVKTDCETALLQEFKKQIKQLPFAHQMQFTSVENSGNTRLFLQGTFEGRGEYEFKGRAHIYSETDGGNLKCALYDIGGRVLINADEDDAPIVSFIGKLSVHEYH